MSGIRFASKIRLVTGEAFSKLPTLKAKINGETVGPPWMIHNRLRSPQQGYTDEIECCNAGGIVNSEKVVLFHLYPSSHWMQTEIPKIQQALASDIRELAAAQKPVRGFIVGGDANDSWSLHYARALEALFKALNIPYSVLWGQRRFPDMQSRVYYSVAEDTWSVHTTYQKPGEYNLRALKTVREFQKGFSRIQIDPGDTIEVDGTAISAEQINQHSWWGRLLNRIHLPKLVKQVQATLGNKQET